MSDLGDLGGTIRSLKVVFTGIDRVSHVAEGITGKVRALGGAIAAIGGTGILITQLGEQFGFLDKAQSDALNKTFGLVTATGSLITVFARLIPILQGLAIAQTLANAARAVALALSGPIGWGILAGAAVALAAFGIYMATQTGVGPPQAVGGERQGGALRGLHRGQFGLDAMVAGPTLFLAGEAGRERVTITPEDQGAGGGIGPISIHIYGSTDPAATARAVKRELELLISKERLTRS